MLERYPMVHTAATAYSVKQIYDELVGYHTKWKNYDMEITADKAHKNSKYSSYLWVDSDGTFMLSPIVYENDKVVIGYRKGFMLFPSTSKFVPLMTIPLDGASPAPDSFQEEFSSILVNEEVELDLP